MVKNLPDNVGYLGSVPRLGIFPGEGCQYQEYYWQPTSVLLSGESHGQRNLAGYSPQGCKESDMTEVT